MATLGKTYHSVIDAVDCTIARFLLSDQLMTAEDPKLEHLEFTLLFTIFDVLCVNKTRQMHVTRRYKKLRTDI